MKLPSPWLASAIVVHGFLGCFSDVQFTFYQRFVVPLSQFYNASLTDHYGLVLDENDVTRIQTLLTNVQIVASVLGTMFLLQKMDSMGRKQVAVYLRSFFGICASLGIVFARIFNSFELFLVSNFLIGIQKPLRMGVLKMYVSECAPNAIRGFSVSSITTMTLLGDLTLGFLALVNVFGNEQSWHFAALGYLIWTLIYLVLGSILPESPKFKRLKNAPISTIEKTVRRFHGKNANVHEVIEEYDMEIHLTNSGHTTFLALFKDPALRDSLLLAFVGALSSPLSPNLILMVSNIQLKMRFGMTNAFAVGLDTIAGFFAIPTALLVPFAIEKFGRRPIILLTISCNVVICILLFVAQLWIDLTGRANTFTMICSVVLSILDYITVSAGVGLFFIVIIADLLPASAKAATTQAAILANSFGTILTSLYFGGFEQRFGAAIHLPILLLQIFFLVFFARNLPETKQRPVYENYVQIKSRTNSVVSSRVRSRLHTASSVKKYGSLSENSVC